MLNLWSDKHPEPQARSVYKLFEICYKNLRTTNTRLSCHLILEEVVLQIFAKVTDRGISIYKAFSNLSLKFQI